MSLHKVNTQVTAVTQSLNSNQVVEEIAFFGSNGVPVIMAPTTTVTTNDAAATAAKTTTSAEPPANSYVAVKYAGTGGNSVAHTLAFAGGTARTIWLGGAPATAAKHTTAINGVIVYWFDGTILHQLGSM